MIKNKVAFVAGLVCFLFFLLVPLQIDISIERTIGLLLLCALWWGAEAVPIYITSLLPGVFLLLFRIMSVKDILLQYAHPVILLLLGSFLIAHAIMKWQVDRRLTLNILVRAGTNPRLLLLYFLVTTAAVSSFISNTATAAMMFPIGLAVLHNVQMKDDLNYRKVLMLGIAYASTIGGMVTIVGTPANLVCAGFAKTLLGKEITFFDWLKLGLPFAVIMLVITWRFLLFHIKPQTLPLAQDNSLEKQLRELGPLNKGQKITIFVFALAAVLWTTRSFWHLIPVPLAAAVQSRIDDSGVAMLCAALLFIIPMKTDKWSFALGLKDVKYVSWQIMLLFGGGLCLGKGLFVSGAATWLADSIPLSTDMHPLLLIFIVTAITSFVSEFAPNTTVANMMVPIWIATAGKLGLSPHLFLIPATIAASTVFMLPIATPPNAIVYGSGYIRIQDMIKIGFFLHLIGIVILTFLSYLIIVKISGIGPV